MTSIEKSISRCCKVRAAYDRHAGPNVFVDWQADLGGMTSDPLLLRFEA